MMGYLPSGQMGVLYSSVGAVEREGIEEHRNSSILGYADCCAVRTVCC